MARANFTRLTTRDDMGGSEVLDQHIRHVDDAFRNLGDVVNNSKIQTVKFKAGVPVAVGHGLGQPVTFYDQSMHSAPARISVAGPSIDPAKTINLVSDVDVTVALRFT